MEETIKVHVVEYRDRKNLLLAYRDPMTGRLKSKSAKTANRKQAEKAAAVWEDELRNGRYVSPSRTTWADFRERYENEVASGLAVNTQKRIFTVLNVVEAKLNPLRARDITAGRLSWLASELRGSQTEASIQSLLAHLKAALRWGERIGLIAKAPTFPKLQRAKGTGMKGRPISGEEFDRMIAAVPKVVKRPEQVAEWQRYLRGLYLSGFRLTESLALSWDEGSALSVDMSGRYPVVHIKAEGQKSNRDETLAIAPDFAAMLKAVPEADRVGPVFNPLTKLQRATPLVAMQTIAAIGEAAGIKTWTNPRTGVVKFASAHDLRRAFGQRWAAKVMPPVLQQMMRHANIATTMKFYVGRNAQATAAAIYEAFNKSENVNTFVNSETESATERR